VCDRGTWESRGFPIYSAKTVTRIAFGFINPLAVLADDQSGRLLIVDYGAKIIYALQYLGGVCQAAPSD
jgi:hypothetical protein